MAGDGGTGAEACFIPDIGGGNSGTGILWNTYGKGKQGFLQGNSVEAHALRTGAGYFIPGGMEKIKSR